MELEVYFFNDFTYIRRSFDDTTLYQHNNQPRLAQRAYTCCMQSPHAKFYDILRTRPAVHLRILLSGNARAVMASVLISRIVVGRTCMCTGAVMPVRSYSTLIRPVLCNGGNVGSPLWNFRPNRMRCIPQMRGFVRTTTQSRNDHYQQCNYTGFRLDH